MSDTGLYEFAIAIAIHATTMCPQLVGEVDDLGPVFYLSPMLNSLIY